MKKIILICSTVIITVAIVCCAIFAFNHFAYKDEIAVNGAVYTQSGKNITALPVGSTELGMLNSITHRTTSNPTEDFTATNLDEKYAGCMIYQSGDSNSIIYLEDYSGFYIPFELSEHITQPETISFHEKTFNKSDLSAETLEWLERYNALSSEEQLAISSIPKDLYELCGYGELRDAEVSGPTE